MGPVISDKGYSINPKKMKAIQPLKEETQSTVRDKETHGLPWILQVIHH